MTDKFKDLYGANFALLLTRVQEDFDCWSVLNLSLAARIYSVKMNTLPKFLDLCVFPFSSPKTFTKFDSIIFKLYLEQENAKDTQLLQRPKALGGMALPNFRFYYWAANLKIIQSWLQFDSYQSPPICLKMEAASCGPVSLSALAHSPIERSLF